MEFSTRIDISKSPLDIKHENRIMMFGSCFIENIGEKLIESKFKANLNPFGILYNPQSISQALSILIENKKFTEEDIFEHKGLFHSFYHHSRFSDTDKESCLQKINNGIEQAISDLKQADILFITFGTAYVYKSKKQSLVVGNCHKLPESEFDRYRIDVNTIVKDWSILIEKLKDLNSKLKIIFTVSPIRHVKDGMHENQLSKSTLLLAIDELSQSNTNIEYFPSYEIVLDELRDYRFYNEDMIHPNGVAIKYIWQLFKETYFSAKTVTIIEEWAKLHAALNHRPFNELTDNHKLFLKQTMLKLQSFEEKYPYICSNREKIELENRIKKNEE